MKITSKEFFIIRFPANTFQKCSATKEISSDIDFDRSIYLSSRQLWLEKNKKEKIGKDKKLQITLTKYWLRHCTRTIPFGTFAGCALGKISKKNNFRLDRNKDRHHTRFDMGYWHDIVQHLQGFDPIRNRIRYFTNNSLYKIGNSIRYVYYDILEANRNYSLRSIKLNQYLELVLNTFSTGAYIEDFVAKVTVLESNLSVADIQSFIFQLVESQILHSELLPHISGPDNLEKVIKAVADIDDAEPYRDMLYQSHQSFQDPVFDIPKMESLLSVIHSAIQKEPGKNPYQVDLFNHDEGFSLSEEIIDKIMLQLAELHPLFVEKNNQRLKDFAQAFKSRYGSRQIPLYIALDPEIGIGYGDITDQSTYTPLVDDLNIRSSKKAGPKNAVPPLQRFVFDKFMNTKTGSSTCIRIKEEDVSFLRRNTAAAKFNGNGFILGHLLFNQNTPDANEDFRFILKACSGSSPIKMLSRFAHCHENILKHIKEIATEEQGKADAILAEIVHLPHSKIGNVSMRPQVRAYEIPYVTPSISEDARQITISDLMISVHGDNIVIESKSLQKRVIPKLSTAHNYTQSSLPAYRFLCDLQTYSDFQGPHWNWGNLSSQKFLPRVEYKNLILSRATWIVTTHDIAPFIGKAGMLAAFFKRMQEEQHLPRQVVYTEGDNELLIDTEDEISLEILFGYIKKYGSVLLVEFMSTEESCSLYDTEDNPYISELLFPINFSS